MKYTLLVTQRCNLACDYCYVGKRPFRMSPITAGRVVDFAFRNTPPNEPVDFGFFGGEPLLEFDLVRRITRTIEAHPDFDRGRTSLTVVTNGTIFNSRIADFIEAHGIALGISCDGTPKSHDRHRRTSSGRATSPAVEHTIRTAVERFPNVMVNAVYRPDTLTALPSAVEYFASLGVRQIYLNPDFSAAWSAVDAARLDDVYGKLGEMYRSFYRSGDRHFVSPLDGKIVAVLRGGYQPQERCRMGRAEFAFTPDGSVYPCERLVGAGDDIHRIGRVDDEVLLDPVLCTTRVRDGEAAANAECAACSLRSYCMNWCGCSNYFSTGDYGRVGAFLCASERAAIRVALDLLQALDGMGAWYDHVSGRPNVGVLAGRRSTMALPMVGRD